MVFLVRACTLNIYFWGVNGYRELNPRRCAACEALVEVPCGEDDIISHNRGTVNTAHGDFL